METIFIVIVGILFLLAVIDLTVGVSNDAVNFLVSAIGSNAAPLRVIMIIASLGVLFGATFSGGMMEVARKGIFHPELFSFNEIMIIFLAVMLTDIILLDVFNTLGMPTSTTVSIVFELLGSAVAMSIVLVLKDKGGPENVTDYINSDKALMIIAGILLSVVVAFTVGAIVQYLSRLLFSFNTKNTYKKFGALWGSIAITAITYFILIKGLKGSAFSDYKVGTGETVTEWIKSHTMLILLISFVAWGGILAILQLALRVNILKIIVLTGTFALAMAFAGNDLVNFIGVPLAGLASFKSWAAAGGEPTEFMMSGLGGAVETPTLFLIIAGLIMVVTLWFSKKARAVTKTSIDLSRQNEGSERFESFGLARGMVRLTRQASKFVDNFVPPRMRRAIESRFEAYEDENEKEEQKAFDLIRAGVNLMVAGVLISIGTSLKLPLSTTYVTFMVAMGTSLADRAWGRESAVYRVSGVLTVIAGWFITAIVAFTVAFIFANLINWGGIIAIALILLLAVVSVLRTQIFKKKSVAIEKESKEIDEPYGRCKKNITELLAEIPIVLNKTLSALERENRKKLKKRKKNVKKINEKSKLYKENVYLTVQKFAKHNIDTGPYFVQVLDYLREITHAVTYIVKPSFDHINNNHKTILPVQKNEISELLGFVGDLFSDAVDIIRTEKFDSLETLQNKQQEALRLLENYREVHIRRIENREVSTRNTILYLGLIAEIKNLFLFLIKLVKSQRDFVLEHKKETETK